MLVIGFQAFKK